MESALLEVVDHDVGVKAVIENTLPVGGPQVLGHAHDDASWLLHAVHHVLR